MKKGGKTGDGHGCTANVRKKNETLGRSKKRPSDAGTVPAAIRGVGVKPLSLEAPLLRHRGPSVIMHGIIASTEKQRGSPSF